MSCKSKIKHTCGNRVNANCTFYDGFLSEDSELLEESCVVISETTAELYKITDSIKQEIDLSSLGTKCLSYQEQTAGDVQVNEALVTFEEEICVLKDSISNLPDSSQDIDITQIDTKCLLDNCSTGINSPTELIQSIIDTLCTLIDQVNS